MDKGKIAGGILSLTLVGLAIGYVVATGYLTIRYGLSTQALRHHPACAGVPGAWG